MKGNPNTDTQAYTRIDGHTSQVVAKKGGKVTVTSRVVISEDGKTRTSTQTGTNADGQAVHVVYERQ